MPSEILPLKCLECGANGLRRSRDVMIKAVSLANTHYLLLKLKYELRITNYIFVHFRVH